MLKRTTPPEVDLGRHGRLRPLILACFGRGGSNIVYSALGSTARTLILEREWHQIVFERADWAKRVLRVCARHGLGHGIGLGNGPAAKRLRRHMRARLAADIRQSPPWFDRTPDWLVVKLMDYNLVRHQLVEATLGKGQTVLLTRAPLPQCESLMRSGVPLREACRWYADTAGFMARIRTPETVTLKFEDLVQDPEAMLGDTLRLLGLGVPQRYLFKDKRFGAERQMGTDVTAAPYRSVAPHALASVIRSDVNRRAAARLSSQEISEITTRTAEAAAQLGYTPHDY